MEPHEGVHYETDELTGDKILAGHDYDGYHEPEPAEDRQNQLLVQAPDHCGVRLARYVFHYLKAGEQDRTVRGNKRQEHSERLVKRREEFSDVHLHKLDGACDYKNEADIHHYLQSQRLKYEIVNQPGERPGKCYHKCYCTSHAERHIDSARDTEVRADTEKFCKH